MPHRLAIALAALTLPATVASTADAARPLPQRAAATATPSRTLSLIAVPRARAIATPRRTTRTRRTAARRAKSSARRARTVTALRDERDLPAVLRRAPAVARTFAPPTDTPVPLAPIPDAPEQPAETVPPPSSPAPGTETPPTTPIVAIGASLREWLVGLSRSTVPAGSYTIQLQNFGEDPHDLVIEDDDTGSAVGSFDVTSAAVNATTPTVASKRFTLAAGTYTLYCSLPGHRARGMQTTLTVTEP